MIHMNKTDVFSMSPIIQEILNLNKEMQKNLVSLRFTVDRQAGEISALNEAVKATHQPTVEQQKEDTMLSRKEAAELLDVHPVSLYRWEKSRELIPVRIGAKIYYSKRKIEEKLKKY